MSATATEIVRPANPLEFFVDSPAAPRRGPNEHVIIARAIVNTAGNTVFPSWSWGGVLPEPDGFSWYTCLSTSSSIPDADWRVSRTESRMSWSYLLAADDVGTKVARAAILAALPPPTVEIETSPGNCQWLWGLSPRANPAQVRAALAWLADRGLTDPACLGANRLIRVPKSCNCKSETLARNGGKPFFARVATLRPDRLYELRDLVPLGKLNGAVMRRARRNAAPFTPELARADRVYQWLKARGLVMSEPNGDGWVEIRCPWAHLHTDPSDDLAGWKIGWRGHFHCFHAHGAEQRTPQFLSWISQQAQRAGGDDD